MNIKKLFFFTFIVFFVFINPALSQSNISAKDYNEIYLPQFNVRGILYAPSNKKLYVTGYSLDNTMQLYSFEFDANDNPQMKSLTNLPNHQFLKQYQNNLAINPDGKQLFIPKEESGKLISLDTTTKIQSDIFLTGINDYNCSKYPFQVSNIVNNNLFVSLTVIPYDFSPSFIKVFKIDVLQNKIASEFDLNQFLASGIVLTPNGKKLYVGAARQASSINVFNPLNFQVIKRIPLSILLHNENEEGEGGMPSLLMSTNADRLYALSPGYQPDVNHKMRMQIIDTVNDIVVDGSDSNFGMKEIDLGTISIPRAATLIMIKNKEYICLGIQPTNTREINYVLFIDPQTGENRGVIGVNVVPKALAYIPQKNLLFIVGPKADGTGTYMEKISLSGETSV